MLYSSHLVTLRLMCTNILWVSDCLNVLVESIWKLSNAWNLQWKYLNILKMSLGGIYRHFRHYWNDYISDRWMRVNSYLNESTFFSTKVTFRRHLFGKFSNEQIFDHWASRVDFPHSKSQFSVQILQKKKIFLYI